MQLMYELLFLLYLHLSFFKLIISSCLINFSFFLVEVLHQYWKNEVNVIYQQD